MQKPLEVGKVYYHTVKKKFLYVTAGQYIGAYGGISNHYTWRYIKKDGTLGKEDKGYANKELRKEFVLVEKAKVKVTIAAKYLKIPKPPEYAFDLKETIKTGRSISMEVYTVAINTKKEITEDTIILAFRAFKGGSIEGYNAGVRVEKVGDAWQIRAETDASD